MATPAAEQAGPSGAFVAGQEGAARQQIFNRIAPVYDQVRLDRHCPGSCCTSGQATDESRTAARMTC